MASTPGSSLSVFALLDILRRRAWILVLTTLLLTGGFGLYAYMQPDRYRATAHIAATQMATPQYLKDVAPPALNIEDHLWTVREVLFSDPVLESAAKTAKAYQSANAHPSHEGPSSHDPLDEIREHLGIKVESEHAFQITFEAGDPHDAMNVTNKLAEEFVQKASAKREQKTTEAGKVFDDQLGLLKKRMEQQSRQIHDYKSKAVTALPDHMDDNLRGIESTREHIQDKETKIAEEQARRSSIERELGDLEAKGVLNQPVIHQKSPDEDKLDQLRIELGQLQTRYTAAHPNIVAIKRQISDLEKLTSSQPNGRDEPSPTYLRYSQLKSELEGIDQRMAAYRRDQTSLNSQLQTYSTRLAATPQHEKVIEDLDRELKVGEIQFHALLDKQLDTSLAKGFEQSESGIAFTVVEPAGLPNAPHSPQRLRLILMGLAAGLGIGLGLIFLLEQNDTTFGTVDDFQAFTTLPVAGVVPNVNYGKKKGKGQASIVTLEDPDSVAAEQYRILAMRVQQQCDSSQAKVIVITSAAGGEGKSLTAINLATALSSTANGRVLLIDADMRKPRIAEYLKLRVPSDRGFHNLLVQGEGKPDLHITQVKQLSVISGGVAEANPVAALSSPKARALFEQLRQQFGYIIVDAPPVLPIADSQILAGLADRVLFVVRARQTPRELFQHAVESFEAGSLLGAVLNDVDYQRSRYAYAYEYYKKAA